MSKLAHKVKSLIAVTLGGTAVFCGVCIFKGNEKFYNRFVMPVIHKLDPETAHELAVTANKYNLFPKSRFEDPKSLEVKLLGKCFSNPVGIAAGFDKNGEAIKGLHNLGFGFVEIGSVTPKPQPGNPKPRVFRLPEDKAVINRYGFNSHGHDTVLNRVQAVRESKFNGIVGVNFGKNKDSDNPICDYVEGVKKFGSTADYFVINISSPNTPGLRSMQNKKVLKELLSALVTARNSMPPEDQRPLLLKLAPDLSVEDKRDIAEVLKMEECKVDGLIICNTTTERPSLNNIEFSNESGGLSGKPLCKVSTEMIAEMYDLTDGLTIIGVGGIFSGKDAYEKIKAGASLVQVYTGFIYHGPPCATTIKKELIQLMAADGYTNISQAIGTNAKKK